MLIEPQFATPEIEALWQAVDTARARSVALVASQVPERRLGWALGWLSTGQLVGSLVGPVVGMSQVQVVAFRVLD